MSRTLQIILNVVVDDFSQTDKEGLADVLECSVAELHTSQNIDVMKIALAMTDELDMANINDSVINHDEFSAIVVRDVEVSRAGWLHH